MRTHITHIAIALALILMVIGCNSERRATRLIHKSVRVDKPTVDKYYADNYRVTDSTDTRVVLLPGETITDSFTNTDTVRVNDTVYITKVKTINNNKTDTFHISKFERQQNTAVIKAMQRIQDELNNEVNKVTGERDLYKAEAKRVKKNNTKLGIIIACYIAFKFLMMWLSTKFPASKIINVARKVF